MVLSLVGGGDKSEKKEADVFLLRGDMISMTPGQCAAQMAKMTRVWENPAFDEIRIYGVTKAVLLKAANELNLTQFVDENYLIIDGIERFTRSALSGAYGRTEVQKLEDFLMPHIMNNEANRYF